MATSPPTWQRALAFAAGLLVLHGIGAYAYGALIGDRHKASRSDAMWDRAPDKVDLVFLGDSHPRSAIDPKIIGKNAVNLATGGEHYTKSYYRIKKLYEGSDRSIRSIVIPLDPNGFTSWHADNFAPEYVWGRYVDFLELGAVRNDRWTYLGKWAKAHVTPYSGELRTFNQIRSKRFGFGEALANGRFDGLGPKARVHAAREAASAHFEGCDTLDPRQIWGFEQLIAWAEGEGIQVIAISYPLRVLPDYGDPRPAVQKAIIDTLAERHPNVLHLDYTDLYRGQPDLFADPHHLNRRGRILFTREVGLKLVEHGLLPPRPKSR